MKLAEALAERSDCQVRLEDLRKRVVRSARVQEGEKPAEDSEALLQETETLHSRLLELIMSINRTLVQPSIRSGPSPTRSRSGT